MAGRPTGIAMRLVLAALVMSALGSCSFVYDLRAVVQDGHLAFVPEGSWLTRPDCLYAISVEAVDRAVARAEPGDDAADVARGVFWAQFMESQPCRTGFPVRYGQALEGKPFVFDGGPGSARVAAKPLQPGVLYYVFALSPGSGSGGGYFRLDGRGGVENVPRERVSQSVSLPSSS
ncbi:hypothetical protein MTR62_04935 [Novosphingobium sp. 1949]|uniref:Lipoprotein n=1 Tax=Novosphingobium organovorum TaxID=2930092 RepID=A0ABT0BAE8_9SPHN|nr:hypothetical protein [Novosphingobium organovorum]MCJ2182050.1 hypothetical protein [Novosphingobium organovorum]